MKEESVMKTLITTGLAAASLALIGTTAMAAPSPANPLPRYAQSLPAHTWQGRAPLHVAARRPLPAAGRLNVDVAQFVRGMLGGGPVPYANLVRDVRSLRGAGGGSYDWSSSPTYSTDSGTSNIGTDTAAAALEEDQTIQQMNDTNAETASMAAAEAANDAANAATLQTEINAGM
jgi:hypothetical protein